MKRAESSTVEGSALSFIGDRAPSSPDSSGGRGASGPPLNIRRAAELPRTAGGYRAGIGTEPTTTGALPRHPHRFRHGSCQPPVHASGTDADFGTVPPRRLPSDASPAPARLLSRPELRRRDSGQTARLAASPGAGTPHHTKKARSGQCAPGRLQPIRLPQCYSLTGNTTREPLQSEGAFGK